jgi:hypothetical protein
MQTLLLLLDNETEGGRWISGIDGDSVDTVERYPLLLVHYFVM